MSLLPTFDMEKCILCGKCVYICPHKILSIKEKRIGISADECLLCSHCASVCPVEAVSFDPYILRQPEFSSFPYKEAIIPPGTGDPEYIINLFRSRRSVRTYKPETPDRKILEDLIEFAVTAPSGSNCQNWEFTVLLGAEKVWGLALEIKKFFIRMNRLAKNPLVRYLSAPFTGSALITYYKNHLESVEMAIRDSEQGIDRLFHAAPSLIILHSDMEGSTPVEDAQYASYNMAILGHTIGIGTCYIGYAVESINRDRGLKRYLTIPAEHRVHAVLTAGYPSAPPFLRPALRKPYPVNYL